MVFTLETVPIAISTHIPFSWIERDRSKAFSCLRAEIIWLCWQFPSIPVSDGFDGFSYFRPQFALETRMRCWAFVSRARSAQQQTMELRGPTPPVTGQKFI